MAWIDYSPTPSLPAEVTCRIQELSAERVVSSQDEVRVDGQQSPFSCSMELRSASVQRCNISGECLPNKID
jgi:hypothetical protein